MSNSSKPEVGSITWFDLTVPDAEKVKDFYSKVIGWKSAPVSMGDYNDFNMNSPESGKTNAGICHKRGGNAHLPSQWMIYITVKSAEASAKIDSPTFGRTKKTSPAIFFGLLRLDQIFEQISVSVHGDESG